MQTRTKNAIAALVLAAALGLCVFALTRGRGSGAPSLSSRALDAVPAGALVVAVADLEALRASPLGPKLLASERDIPGLGSVREVCGIDPMERVRQIAFAIPAGGDEGDFGFVAAGDIPDEELLSCAARVIEKRGGRPVITNIGSFRTVRDATLVLSGAEIAVKKGGPILLGAGAYLRAMIDAADGRVPGVRTSVAHARLGELVSGDTVRASIVLTPAQRDELAKSLADEGGPRAAASIVAGALGVSIGAKVALHAVIACEDTAACADVAALITRARDRRAADVGTRIIGVSRVLEAMSIRAEAESVQITAEMPTEEAAVLVERLLILRGARHPMPSDSAAPSPSSLPATSAGPAPSGVPSASAAVSAASDAGAPDAMAPPAPDVVLTAKGAAGAPPNDAGVRDAGK